MRYRLRTLLIATFVGPAVLAMIWWIGVEIFLALSRSSGGRFDTAPPGSPLLRGAVCAVVVLYPVAAVLLALALRSPQSEPTTKPLELAALFVATVAAIASLVLLIAPVS